MRAAILSSALLFACTSYIDLELPDPPSGARTVMLLRVPQVTEPDGISGIVLPIGAFAIDNEAYDHALYFSDADLGLAIGERFDHDSVDGSWPQRPLGANRLEGSAWVDDPMFVTSAAVRKLRLPTRDDAPCRQPQACFVGDPRAGKGLFCGPGCGLEPSIAPPIRPELPRITGGCPAGFRTRTATHAEITFCDVAEMECRDAGFRRALGACAPIGRACDGRRWPASPGGVARWVADDAVAGGGDGTEASPWALATALARADPGDVLLVSTGTHAATARVSLDVSIHGACAASTRVNMGPLEVSAPSVIDGATIRASTLTITSSGALSLEGAALFTTGGTSVVEGALRASGSLLSARRVNVWGTIDMAESEQRDTTLEMLTAAAYVRLHRVIAAGDGLALYVRLGSMAEITESSLRRSGDDGAVMIVGAATVAITRTQLAGTNAAIHAHGGSRVHLAEVWFGVTTVVVDSFAAPGHTNAIVARDVYLERAHSGFLGDLQTTFTLERVAATAMADAFLRAARSAAVQRLSATDITLVKVGRGFDTQARHFALERLELIDVVRPLKLSQLVDTEDTALAVRDVRIVRARVRPIILSGNAKSTEDGPFMDASLERIRIEDSGGAGIAIHDDGVHAVIRDLEIDGIYSPELSNIQLESDCDNNSECTATGIVTRSAILANLTLDLHNFRIVNVESAGITLDAVTSIFASQGRINAKQIGIYHRGRFDWQDRLSEVRLDAMQAVSTVSP